MCVFPRTHPFQALVSLHNRCPAKGTNVPTVRKRAMVTSDTRNLVPWLEESSSHSLCVCLCMSLCLSLSLCLTKEVSAYFTQATELTNDDAETAVKVFNSAVKLAYREFGKHMQVENSEELPDPIFCNDNILVETKLFFIKSG